MLSENAFRATCRRRVARHLGTGPSGADTRGQLCQVAGLWPLAFRCLECGLGPGARAASHAVAVHSRRPWRGCERGVQSWLPGPARHVSSVDVVELRSRAVSPPTPGLLWGAGPTRQVACSRARWRRRAGPDGAHLSRSQASAAEGSTASDVLTSLCSKSGFFWSPWQL